MNLCRIQFTGYKPGTQTGKLPLKVTGKYTKSDKASEYKQNFILQMTSKTFRGCGKKLLARHLNSLVLNTRLPNERD
jgi:hypothetical protein